MNPESHREYILCLQYSFMGKFKLVPSRHFVKSSRQAESCVAVGVGSQASGYCCMLVELAAQTRARQKIVSLIKLAGSHVAGVQTLLARGRRSPSPPNTRGLFLDIRVKF